MLIINYGIEELQKTLNGSIAHFVITVYHLSTTHGIKVLLLV